MMGGGVNDFGELVEIRVIESKWGKVITSTIMKLLVKGVNYFIFFCLYVSLQL